ncbi:MAG: hypothetical protein ACO3BD_01755, partial [Chitinophagaceae bacterium]
MQLRQIIFRCWAICLLSIISSNSLGQQWYVLKVHWQDSMLERSLNELQTNFTDREACLLYINRLPALLQAKGYITASLDSMHVDSSFASVFLFAGRKYQWKALNVDAIEPALLNNIGYRDRLFTSQVVSFSNVQQLQQRLLQWLENNGYPFASLRLDSVVLEGDRISAQMKLDKGPLYRIDSIRVFGNVNIRNQFLQRYLEMPAGAIFKRNQLQQISQRI